MSPKGLLITNITLLFVNVLTVIANIYLPRIIDRSNVQVVSLHAFVDAGSVNLPHSNVRVVSSVLEVRRESDEFIANGNCFHVLEQRDTVPADCVDALTGTLTEIVRNSINERADTLSYLSEIDDFDEARLREVLSNNTPLGYISRYYDEVFFKLLAAENFASDDMGPPLRTALVQAAQGLVEREYAYIPYLEESIVLLETRERSERRDVLFRIAVLNSGHVADVIFPDASIRLEGTRSIQLTLIDEWNLRAVPDHRAGEHRAIDPGEALALYYYLDRRLNTISTNEFVSSVFEASTSIQFDFTLNTFGGQVGLASIMEPEVISFEAEFPD